MDRNQAIRDARHLIQAIRSSLPDIPGAVEEMLRCHAQTHDHPALAAAWRQVAPVARSTATALTKLADAIEGK